MRSLRFATIIGACLGLAGTVVADTINVPGDHSTIQAAINASADGDVIEIAADTYNEYNIDPSGKAITIQGTLDSNGSLATTIDAQHGGSVFIIQSGEGPGTVIKDLVITGGFFNNSDQFGGGGINLLATQDYVASNPTIIGCTISNNNTTSSGGGIACNSACSPVIQGCTIQGNHAQTSESSWGGGIFVGGGEVPRRGGQIVPNTTVIIDCKILNNSAGLSGGGIYCFQAGNANVTGCTISNNSAGLTGGGIHCSSSSSPTMSNCNVTNNGIFGGNSQYNPDDQQTWYAGGGIYSNGPDPIVSNCNVSVNTAGAGGGIFIGQGSLAIKNCTILGNQALYPGLQGGGIYVSQGHATITGSTISENDPDGIVGATTTTRGGGMGSGYATLQDTTICSNGNGTSYLQLAGFAMHFGGNLITDTCNSEPGDLNGDGDVDFSDVQAVQALAGICSTDNNGDGVINIGDLLALIEGWGTSCSP